MHADQLFAGFVGLRAETALKVWEGMNFYKGEKFLFSLYV